MGVAWDTLTTTTCRASGEPRERTMTDLATLSPQEIHALAISLARQDQKDRHWSRLAQILGYVEASRLFELPEFGNHATLRAWALNDLNLGSGDVGTLRRLFTMMKSHVDAIPLAWWQDVARGKAEVLLKIHKMGADDRQMASWYERAKALTTTGLEDEYKRSTGDDVWVSVEMSLPEATAALWFRALECRLADAMDQPGNDPAIIHDRAVQHKLVELIASEVIQLYGKTDVNT
jgi:hypothetical protein